MTSEELRESVSRAVMGARNTPPPTDPFVMDEESRAAASFDPGGHHGFVPGGGGDVSVTGTDGVTVKGSSIVFASEDDSNITVKATKDEETGVITVKVGVYWWRG